MSEPVAASRQSRGASLAAFLAMAFLVSALAGLFATYAAPAPYARALAIEGAIDAAEQAGDGALAALAARLTREGFSCPEAQSPPSAARLRSCVRAASSREGAAVAWRLRWLIGLASLTSAAFAIALFGARRR
jgi:hypothetical protein